MSKETSKEALKNKDKENRGKQMRGIGILGSVDKKGMKAKVDSHGWVKSFIVVYPTQGIVVYPNDGKAGR